MGNREALLHPQEVSALFCGIVFYITIPSMYMLLQIYSMFNMNDVSWGTRENAQPIVTTDVVKQPNAGAQTRFEKIWSNLTSKKSDEEGTLDFSFGGIFRCMCCTRQKQNNDLILSQLSNQIEMLGEKLDRLQS